MKRASQRHLPVYVTQVSLTALLDLVLVVLLVFVVAVPLLRREKILETPPPAPVAEIVPTEIIEPTVQIILRIEPDQSIWLNKKLVTGTTLLSALKEELIKNPDCGVLVQMPENFAAGALAKLMEEMHRAGVQKTAVEVVNAARKP